MKKLVLEPAPTWQRREGLIMGWLHGMRLLNRVNADAERLRLQLLGDGLNLTADSYLRYSNTYRFRRIKSGVDRTSDMLAYWEWRGLVADLIEQETLCGMFEVEPSTRLLKLRERLLLDSGDTVSTVLPFAPADPERRIGRADAYLELVRFLEDEVLESADPSGAYPKLWDHARGWVATVLPDAYRLYRRRQESQHARMGRLPAIENLFLQSYDDWRRTVAAAAEEERRCMAQGRPLSQKYGDLRRALLLEQGEPLPG